MYSRRTLITKIVVAGGFLLVAVLGFRSNFWLVVAALIGHGVLDFVHRFFIDNPGVPPMGHTQGGCLLLTSISSPDSREGPYTR
jgi:hypothetical protein